MTINKSLAIGLGAVLVAALLFLVWRARPETRPGSPFRDEPAEDTQGRRGEAESLSAPSGQDADSRREEEHVPRILRPAAEEEIWRLRVRVVDSAGAPVRGADVRFVRRRTGQQVRALTDEEGRAALEVAGAGTLAVMDVPEHDAYSRQGITPRGFAKKVVEVRLSPIGPFGPTDLSYLASTGGARGPLGGRGGHRNLKAYGGGAETERTADFGLAWLARHQAADGRWDADGFEVCCVKQVCGGAGDARADVATTGLALLAFLGSGETHAHGREKERVAAGLRFLVAAQESSGRFGEEGDLALLGHAMATHAVVEAYALTGATSLRESAERALRHLADERFPGRGWGDVTVWALSAFRAAKIAGLDPDPRVLREAGAWLLEEERGDAADAAALFLVGHIDHRSAEEEWFREKIERVVKRLPRRVEGEPDPLLYWHFGSLAVFHFATKSWKTWNEALKKALPAAQAKDGCRKGAFGAAEGDPLGRVGATAIGAMTFQVYYRWARTLGKPR
jgi:hypothetical protein